MSNLPWQSKYQSLPSSCRSTWFKDLALVQTQFLIKSNVQARLSVNRQWLPARYVLKRQLDSFCCLEKTPALILLLSSLVLIASQHLAEVLCLPAGEPCLADPTAGWPGASGAVTRLMLTTGCVGELVPDISLCFSKPFKRLPRHFCRLSCTDTCLGDHLQDVRAHVGTKHSSAQDQPHLIAALALHQAPT